MHESKNFFIVQMYSFFFNKKQCKPILSQTSDNQKQEQITQFIEEYHVVLILEISHCISSEPYIKIFALFLYDIFCIFNELVLRKLALPNNMKTKTKRHLVIHKITL